MSLKNEHTIARDWTCNCAGLSDFYLNRDSFKAARLVFFTLCVDYIFRKYFIGKIYKVKKTRNSYEMSFTFLFIT